MKLLNLKISAAGLLSLAGAQSAYAHDGEHSAYVLSNIVHWLCSPSHSLLALVGGISFFALSYWLVRKPRRN